MKLKNITSFLLSLTLLAGCAAPAGGSSGTSAVPSSESSSQPEAVYHKLTPQEAKKRMEEGSVTIVDVRTQEEYDQQHIPDAVLVPNETIGDTMPELLPDTEATLLVYCRSGRRSKEASDKLVALGYQQVYDFGGIIDWPYDTVSEEK